MNPMRCHFRSLVTNAGEPLRRRAVRSLIMLLLASCVLGALCPGCGEQPKPVSGTDVSPIQLHAQPRPKPISKAETSAAQPAPSASSTAPAAPAGQMAPGIMLVPKNCGPDGLPQTTAVNVPPRQTQPATAAQPAQTPPRQDLSLQPTQPAQPTVPEQPTRTTPAAAPVPQGQPTPVTREAATPLLKNPEMADQMVSVNFEAVDIRTVLKTIGEITGINFIPHQSVTGTVTVMSPTPIRLGDIYAFLQSILDVYGYAAVETENAVKIVPKADAARNYAQVRIGADPAYIPRNDVIVTQIIPLKYADAAEVSQILQPVLAAGAQMATYPRTNSIMITDTSANIHHVAQIVARLDVEGSRQKATLLPLTHASARVVSEQIMGILDKTRAASAQAGRARPAQGADQGPNILPDDRTNALIIVASEQDIEMVSHLARQLDVERAIGSNNVQVVYLKNADANEVAPSLKSALTSMRLTGAVEATQPVQVNADKSTNSLIIVATPQDFEIISDIINKLDIVREQIFVEMQIIEVTEEALQEIGVDWATLDDAVADSIRGFGMTNLGPRTSFLNGTAEGLSVGAWQGTGDDVKIGAILQALKKESGVNILSTPQILTSNHRKAVIIVGENRPFVTQSRITETADPVTPTVIQGFEYKDVGITLEVTPHVSQGGLIRMEISSEFTKLIEDVAAQSLNTPVTAKRTAKTVVTMASGATVVIGGLIRDDKTRVTKKVPLLGDIPVIGAIFSSRRDRTQKTNLLIFITPHVMTTQEQLLQMTNTKRDQMPPASEEDR